MKKSRLALLLSLLFVFAVAFAPFALADPSAKTIVDVAREINADTGEFSTLLAAISAADPAVLNTLSGDGQFTVFAPTDAAFRVIGMDKDNVGKSFRQDVLTSILLYHVSPDRLYKTAVLGSDRIPTLLRGKDRFLIQNAGVLTDNLGRETNIIRTDIEAANGTIHVIDRVMLPQLLK